MSNLISKIKTTGTTTPEYDLGAIAVVKDKTNGGYKKYKYIKYSASAVGAAANGTVVCAEDVYYTTGTDDVSASLGINHVLGVAIGAIAAGSYGWIQVMGYHSAVKTNGDDDISKGDSVIPGADGVCDSVAAGTAPTYTTIGIAAADDVDAANTVATNLNIANSASQFAG